MSFFRRFRANFNLKNPKKRKIDKSESIGVQCLKYKIISEFAEQQVFNTSPRQTTEPQPTTTPQSNVRAKSIAEKDSQSKQIVTEHRQDNKKIESKPKNVIWPSESEINTVIESKQSRETREETKIERPNDEIEETKQEAKQPVIKSILKNAEVKKDSLENGKGKVNFGFQNGEEDGTYEPYEKIDDHVIDNNMYFCDQAQEEDKELYVVHKVKHEQQSSVNSHEAQPPVYNILTHPKLNPTAVHYGNLEDRNTLNTFGTSQKLRNNLNGYSNQAANIFFDSDDEYEHNNLDSGKVAFEDNGSEMSA